ncbi:DNA-binding protein [Flavobacterium sp. 9R]|uniref:helix-turn-helix domain-containing protein n=1 Tax=Flavobacterium sp. 9R TaxID=2653143 RepID=UPI0012F409C6|nr:helix-turn-helix transcriptional regulator [Flavobacterium sp. 9R]VXB94626.1 DNA-binding protein [Flavobacterium sp. 9R]
MVNLDIFIKRLEYILDYYSMNAATFADRIGVQRSSLSHLLSGRNKPSLDFVLKIVEEFPEVNLYWLLIGKGSFPDEQNSNIENHTPPILPNPSGSEKEKSKIQEENATNEVPTNFSISSTSKQQIEKIIFFYKNGSFKVYEQD